MFLHEAKQIPRKFLLLRPRNLDNSKNTYILDINNISKWLINNKLILNHSKTKWMLFGTRQKLEQSTEINIDCQSKKHRKSVSILLLRSYAR